MTIITTIITRLVFVVSIPGITQVGVIMILIIPIFIGTIMLRQAGA